MKAELAILLAMIAVCTSRLSAKEKFPVAEVDQILTNPSPYDGNILALHGIAGTVALESRTFTPSSISNRVKPKEQMPGLYG